MSTPKWTPGQWGVHPETDGTEMVAYSIPWNVRRLICRIPYPMDAETIANARLIAAAPDLYGALREQMGWTTSGPCQFPMMDPCRCYACKFHRAEVALAKARGDA